MKSYPSACSVNPWVWTKGNSILDYSDWGVNEPAPGGSCVSINIQGAFWSANDCNGNKPYVCQLPAGVGYCDEGWTYSGHTGFCYRFMAVSAGVRDAEQKCVDDGAHLASIHDDEENSFVGLLATTNFDVIHDDSGVWIGLVNDNDASKWVWTDGTPVNYTHWASDNPDNMKNTGVYIFPDGVTNCPYGVCHLYWVDSGMPTVAHRGFICKKAAGVSILPS